MTATPFFLSPLLLVGPPGVGKTWYLKNLARALDLPLVQAPMTSVTLADTFSGANRSWKQATVGLVAKSLLGSLVCNPVFFVDEVDKPATNSWNNDPYRPFYTLLERDTAEAFFDEYLRLPVRADYISWIFSANTIEAIPEPIRNRLTIVRVENPSVAQRKDIVRSVYVEKNTLYNGFFRKTPDEAVVDTLSRRNLRELKRAFDRAMARAAASGRDFVAIADLPVTEEKPTRIGF